MVNMRGNMTHMQRHLNKIVMSGLGKKEEFVCLNSIAFSQILQYVFCQEKTNKQRKQETGRVA